MTTTTQTQSNETSYMNFHAEGVAYVNRLRKVQTRKAEFCSVQLGFMHGKVGNGSKPEITYVDCIIRNESVCEILLNHEEPINNRDVKVTMVARISDIYADKPFELAGEMVSAIKGRLIDMKQLKVAEEIVFKKEPKVSSDEQSSEASNESDEGVESGAPVAEEQNTPEGTLEPVVKLDPNADDFEAEKNRLKALGYIWDKNQQAWVLPEAA